MIDAAGTLRECGIPAATPESHALFRELVALPDRATMRTAMREALAPGPVASTTTDPLEALGIPTVREPVPARRAPLREATRYTEAARELGAREGWAMPDGSYPIRNAQDVENALADFDRSGGRDETARAHILQRAEQVPGGKDRLPPEWGGSTQQAIQESVRLAQLGIPTIEAAPARLREATTRYTSATREVLAREGAARPDGSYPIKTATDVEDAVDDFDRSNGSDADKAHIIRRAEQVGATDKLPATWSGSTQVIQESDRRADPLEALGIPTTSASLRHVRLLA